MDHYRTLLRLVRCVSVQHVGTPPKEPNLVVFIEQTIDVASLLISFVQAESSLERNRGSRTITPSPYNLRLRL